MDITILFETSIYGPKKLDKRTDREKPLTNRIQGRHEHGDVGHQEETHRYMILTDLDVDAVMTPIFIETLSYS